jgi:hypothetical protein
MGMKCCHDHDLVMILCVQKQNRVLNDESVSE